MFNERAIELCEDVLKNGMTGGASQCEGLDCGDCPFYEDGEGCKEPLGNEECVNIARKYLKGSKGNDL